LWVAVADLASAQAALAAGAERVWLDGLDLWAADAPQLADDGSGRLWLRHPAVVATSPHLAALGLPVVAGQLGALRAAAGAGLRVGGDHHLNVVNTQTLRALAEQGAEFAVLSLECSCREVARLAARCAALAADDELPQLALTVHGRVPAMITRQDHALSTGEVRDLHASEREGGLPYQLERLPGATTVLWEGRRLCAPHTVQATAGVVDAWVLELADLDPAAVATTTAAYRELLAGGPPQAVVAATAPYLPHGSFPGHLHQGSRELDRVDALTDVADSQA
ncbi:MAG: hypothetical protein ACYTF0_03380, partial [Planctomycetota bacterium]|jgi:hypothetical protein